MELTNELALRLATLPLAGIGREYPHVEVQVLNGPKDLRAPRDLHPAFFGCLDWHSAVHGHWMLVRLLKTYDLPEARKAMRQTLTPENIQAEVAYMSAPNRGSFERMYGWTWLLMLCGELRDWEDQDGLKWAAALRPLEELIVQRYLEFLPKQTYPIRVGTHTNTAFGLTFALDYGVAAGHDQLRALITQRSLDYFGDDADYPAHLEPGGADFLSPCLAEADLMRRVLGPDEFAGWLHRLLPRGLPPSLMSPPVVSDRTDGQICHLDGLTLSRLWSLQAIEATLSKGDTLVSQIQEAAAAHRSKALEGVFSGDYMGEHWLATFAVYALARHRLNCEQVDICPHR